MTNSSQNFDENVKSNSVYVNEMMQGLKSQVNKSIDYCQSNDSSVYSSKEGNKLYLRMNDIIDRYTVAQKNIMDKLNNEIEFAKHVAETYDELDKKMEGDAKEL